MYGIRTCSDEFLYREEARWRAMEKEAAAQEQYVEELKESTKGSKNTNSVAYNPITLAYHDNHAGDDQKYRDDMCKVPPLRP